MSREIYNRRHQRLQRQEADQGSDDPHPSWFEPDTECRTDTRDGLDTYDSCYGDHMAESRYPPPHYEEIGDAPTPGAYRSPSPEGDSAHTAFQCDISRSYESNEHSHDQHMPDKQRGYQHDYPLDDESFSPSTPGDCRFSDLGYRPSDRESPAYSPDSDTGEGTLHDTSGENAWNTRTWHPDDSNSTRLYHQERYPYGHTATNDRSPSSSPSSSIAAMLNERPSNHTSSYGGRSHADSFRYRSNTNTHNVVGRNGVPLRRSRRTRGGSGATGRSS